MLRLQRGGPCVEISPIDATAIGVKDNDWVEIWNSHGKGICRAKIRAGEQRGRVSMWHTPELYMDLLEGSTQSVCPVRITPTHLVGKLRILGVSPELLRTGRQPARRSCRCETLYRRNSDQSLAQLPSNRISDEFESCQI